MRVLFNAIINSIPLVPCRPVLGGFDQSARVSSRTLEDLSSFNALGVEIRVRHIILLDSHVLTKASEWRTCEIHQ